MFVCVLCNQSASVLDPSTSTISSYWCLEVIYKKKNNNNTLKNPDWLTLSECGREQHRLPSGAGSIQGVQDYSQILLKAQVKSPTKNIAWKLTYLKILNKCERRLCHYYTHKPVRFIQNKPAYSTKSNTKRVLNVVYQSPWSGDQNIYAFPQSETEQHRFNTQINCIQVSRPSWCDVLAWLFLLSFFLLPSGHQVRSR